MKNLFASVSIALSVIPTQIPADPPFPVAATISGIAGVRDGDGILFGDAEIRLQGIAAPEDNPNNREPGGRAATDALERLVKGMPVTCYLDGTTARKRPVGVCVLDGEDLGAWMVRNGFARDCPSYSGGRYAEDERMARRDGMDLSERYALPTYC